MEKYFTEEQLKNSLNALINDQTYRKLDETYQNRFKTIIKVAQSMLTADQKWDESCQFNIVNIGRDLQTKIDIYTGSLRENTEIKAERKKQLLDDIYSSFLRFILELEFNLDDNTRLGIELGECKEAIIQDTQPINSDAKMQIDWAINRMAARMLRFYFNHPNIGDVKKFNENIGKAKDWNESISKKQSEVDAIKTQLDELKYSYNFVGLHKGFENLAAQKRTEKKIAIVLLILIGITILIPLVTKAYFLTTEFSDNRSPAYNENTTSNNNYSNESSNAKNESTFSKAEAKLSNIFTQNQFALFITILSIEIILIYYFRIILGNYSSVKAQLLQIELRKSLCEFIQSYAEYSSAISKDNKEVLKAFENIVFSGIAVEESKVPTTFDGLNEIQKLIKAVR